jgi:hypothetical protein
VQTGVLAKLEALHIPVVFVDYELHPVQNTLPSIALLGKVMARPTARRRISISISSVWIRSTSVWQQSAKTTGVYRTYRGVAGWITAAASLMRATAGVVWLKLLAARTLARSCCQGLPVIFPWKKLSP